MAQKVLEKLGVLEMQAKVLWDRRVKENRLLNAERGKTVAIPLTFDFYLESEEAPATPPPKEVSKITEDQSCDIQKSKRFTSFKCEPKSRKNNYEKSPLEPHIAPANIKNQEEPKVRENRKSRSVRAFHFLKDTTEAENAKPLRFLYAPHRQGCRQSLGSSIFSSITKEKDFTSFIAQSENRSRKPLDSIDYLEDSINKRRKYPPQRKGLSIKENELISKDQSSKCHSIRTSRFVPLCIEDELKNPCAKIISTSRAETAGPHKEQNDTNPIIFHDMKYVEMLLLTKNNFSSRALEKEKIYPCKRANYVLHRNYTTTKSLTSNQHTTLSTMPKTMPTPGAADARACEEDHRVTKVALKMQTVNLTLNSSSWGTLQKLSQTVSSQTKPITSHFNKMGTQGKSSKTVKFERKFSTVMPKGLHKLHASPAKCYLKPFKNTLEIRKLNNVTRLDDLLKLPKEKINGLQNTMDTAVFGEQEPINFPARDETLMPMVTLWTAQKPEMQTNSSQLH